MSSHTADTQLGFLGKLIIEADLTCETGLHIGAGKGTLEIGGADNPVVKNSFGQPYIPGSSLRGAMRHNLERALGLIKNEEMVHLSKRRGQEVRIHQSNRPDDEICLLFGRSAESGTVTAARLSVSDAVLNPDSITQQMREYLDDELTEVKSETAIDRLTAQSSTRTLERVPAGAKFRIRAVLDILAEEDKELIGTIIQSMRLIEDSGLGGGRSRGSGRVSFSSLKFTWRSKEYYSTGTSQKELPAVEDLNTINIPEITEQLS